MHVVKLYNLENLVVGFCIIFVLLDFFSSFLEGTIIIICLVHSYSHQSEKKNSDSINQKLIVVFALYFQRDILRYFSSAKIFLDHGFFSCHRSAINYMNFFIYFLF